MLRMFLTPTLIVKQVQWHFLSKALHHKTNMNSLFWWHMLKRSIRSVSDTFSVLLYLRLPLCFYTFQEWDIFVKLGSLVEHVSISVITRVEQERHCTSWCRCGCYKMALASYQYSNNRIIFGTEQTCTDIWSGEGLSGITALMNNKDMHWTREFHSIIVKPALSDHLLIKNYWRMLNAAISFVQIQRRHFEIKWKLWSEGYTVQEEKFHF